MTLSAISIGIDFQHQYFDTTFLDTLEGLEKYDYMVVDPVRIEALFERSLPPNSALLSQLRNRIYNYVENGGRLICFLRPLTNKNGMTNYDWLFKSEDGSSGWAIQPIRRRTCHVTSHAREWRQYLNYPKIKCLAAWKYSLSGTMTEILSYANDDTVAVRITIGSGILLFLPPIINAEHKRIFIHTLRKTIQGDISEIDSSESAPEWIYKYRLRHEIACDNKIKDLDEKILEMTLEREVLQQKLERLSHLHDLLWGTGVDILEPAVREAFRILGFEAKPQDPIDLVLKCDLGVAFVEIEGTTRMIKVRKIEQLTRYMIAHQPRTQKKVKGILVGNAFRLEDPQNRPPIEKQFSLEIQAFAKSYNITLLSTVTLFQLVDKVMERELDKKSVQSLLFEADGIVKLD